MERVTTLLSKIGGSTAAIGAAAMTAALLAYFRTEASGAIKWFFAPLAPHLPWNLKPTNVNKILSGGLSSELTVVDLYLTATDGKTATYEKTSNYIVGTEGLSSYHEAVTSSGIVGDVSIELGAITKVWTEHGFLVSEIDLGSALKMGGRFRNKFRASFLNSFVAEEEHWTQEVVVPTKLLELRVHFPSDRAPKLFRSKRLIGLADENVSNGAHISELFGKTVLVWGISNPMPGDIFKLEWRW